VTVRALLADPVGRTVFEAEVTPGPDGMVHFTGEADEVATWTAETPDLHELRLSIRKRDVEIAATRLSVGFRDIRIAAGVLRVNGRAVKLLGVNRSNWPTQGFSKVRPTVILSGFKPPIHT